MMSRKFHKHEKGFSFSFDGIIAALVMFGVIIYIAASTQNTYEFASQKIVEKQLADDALTTAYDLNVLQTLDSGTIEGHFQRALPLSYDYQLEVKRYAPNLDFNLESTTTYGSNPDFDTISYVESKKIFTVYSNNDVNAFYAARLRVWVQ